MYGQRIRELRNERNLTQTELAKLLNTTQKSISKYEIESIDISTETLKRLCQIFNVTADYIIGISDDYGTSYKTNNAITYNNSIHNGNNKF